MIQQLAQTNPDMAQYIASNPDGFLQLLGQMGGDGGFDDDGEGEGAGLRAGLQGRHVIQLTQEEHAAIERVVHEVVYQRQDVVN